MTTNKVTFNRNSVKKWRLKEIWYFDKQESIKLNIKLMSLRSVMISDNNKMKILNKINRPQLSLHKYDLTKLLLETNILPAMQNYDSWVVSTFNPLTRFDG